jgi:hypothetical protein
MNEPHFSEILVWNMYGQLFELLGKGMFLAAPSFLATALILVCALCREATQTPSQERRA